MRTILHIDMNSYFASVAQQMNPFLRGKAIGVGGKPGNACLPAGRRGIIAAASQEAKLKGVKTAMSAYEALRVCPELQIVDGDMDAVLDCTRRFLKIFRRYTDAVEVFSVDEAFLDLTNTPCDPVETARAIKHDLRAELGECITCSVGIAPNKLLAKLASGMKKPDGLTVIMVGAGLQPAQASRAKDPRLPEPIFLYFTDLVKTLPATKLCGIGPRVGLRLETMGVKTIADLGETPVGRLMDEFGQSLGYQLHRMGLGEDDSPIVSAEPAPKSFGNSYTLLKDSTDRKELRQILYALTVKMTARMRAEGFSARTVSGWIRYHDFTHEGGRARLAAPSNDPLTIFRAIWQSIKVHLDRPVRLLGAHATDLVQGGEQLVLVAPVGRGFNPATGEAGINSRPTQQIINVADAINARYGPHTLEPASLLHTPLRRHISGFKRGQISSA